MDRRDATGAVGWPMRWNCSNRRACAGGASLSARQNFFGKSLCRRAGRVLARLGPAAGMGLGPRVPAGVPSPSPTWPRACTLEREPERARRVGGRLDEAGRAPAGRRPRPDNPFARGAAPPDGHPTQRRRSASSARPRTRRTADICARSGGCSERACVPRRTQFGLMRVQFE